MQIGFCQKEEFEYSSWFGFGKFRTENYYDIFIEV